MNEMADIAERAAQKRESRGTTSYSEDFTKNHLSGL